MPVYRFLLIVWFADDNAPEFWLIRSRNKIYHAANVFSAEVIDIIFTTSSTIENLRKDF